MDGDKMPYGATGNEIINALKNLDFTPTDEQKEFAEKFHFTAPYVYQRKICLLFY